MCSFALLRPASLEDEEPQPILGTRFLPGGWMERLRPTLDTVWPDRPERVEDVESFLGEAHRRIVAHAESLAGEQGFVPAARWERHARDLLLEHLRLEVDALLGGVHAERLWRAFDETADTAPLGELVATGMMIKLRSVGGFLVLPPTHHEDELTAAEFFAAGRWEEARSKNIAERVDATRKLLHKQIAHLTISRPFPEEIEVYRPSSYRSPVNDLLTLLEEFGEAVDRRLAPEWWPDWLTSARLRFDP